jgi:beta-galactosidase
MRAVSEPTFSRRAVLRAGALGAAVLASGAAAWPLEAEADVTQETPLPQGRYTLDAGWLFGGVYAAGSEQPGHSEAGFQAVCVPHTVTSLSWGYWDPATWEQPWIYRKHISQAAVSGGRVFVDFQGVMTTATVYLNGIALATHQGGYLPFSVELTEHLVAGDNVLAVKVDGTLQDIPPNDVAGGDASIDYLQPAGIYRDVALRIVPEVHIADVFAKPVDVLSAPALEVAVTLDAAATSNDVVVAVALVNGAGATVGSASRRVSVQRGRTTQVGLTIQGLGGISLWSPESPTLYTVNTTVTLGRAIDSFSITTGFREAVFQTDGFYLNGSRYEIFGLNRHQLFPYLGMAGSARLQARDAAIIKHELNCNMVRCSHYPQSEYFLDACDALGLMVWQEPPGWQYVGDLSFREIVLQNVEDMILRDRSRPSVIVWATRLNETSNSPTNQSLYAETDQIAAQLDGSRQTTGAMDIYSATNGWNQQVFAFDDYHSVAGEGTQATLWPPLPGVPYMVSEAVGALDGAQTYRWIDSQSQLALQGELHAQVHNIAQGNQAYAGLLGWCAIDYQSLNGGNRIWNNLKTPGVTDTFRVHKPGAGFYASQQPASSPVIVPGFFWDFGRDSPQQGPGSTVVFTNCEKLLFYVGSATTPTATGTPDTASYGNLAAPPVFVTLTVSSTVAAGSPQLRIDGLDKNGNVVTTLMMSSDPTRDQLLLTLDDSAISGDGTDMTRFTVRGTDEFGNHRPLASTDGTQVTFGVSGPATLLADNPFDFGAYGGVGGGFLRSQAGATGAVTLTATHPTFGTARATLQVVPGSPAAGSAGSSPPRVLTAPPAPDGPPRRPRPNASEQSSARVNTLRDELRRMLALRGMKARIGQLLRHGYTFTFRAPSAGHLVVGWYRVTSVSAAEERAHATALTHTHPKEREKRVLVASASVHIHSKGRARVHVHLTARGKTLLRHVRHEERLEAEAHFTPQGTAQRRVSATRWIKLRR